MVKNTCQAFFKFFLNFILRVMAVNNAGNAGNLDRLNTSSFAKKQTDTNIIDSVLDLDKSQIDRFITNILILLKQMNQPIVERTMLAVRENPNPLPFALEAVKNICGKQVIEKAYNTTIDETQNNFASMLNKQAKPVSGNLFSEEKNDVSRSKNQKNLSNSPAAASSPPRL